MCYLSTKVVRVTPLSTIAILGSATYKFTFIYFYNNNSNTIPINDLNTKEDQLTFTLFIYNIPEIKKTHWDRQSHILTLPCPFFQMPSSSKLSLTRAL